MSRTRIFFINGAILTVTSLIMKSISMLFNLYIANKIGSEAVGVFSLVMSVYMFAITLATSGLSLACTCIVSEQFSKENYLNGLKAVRNCFILALILGLLSSSVILLFSKIISHNWLKSMVSPIPLYLIAIGLPFISVSSVINGYFSAIRKSYKSAFSQFFELFVKITATIILLSFYSSESVESICICLILADIISELSSCVLLIALYKKDISKYCKTSIFDLSFKKRILKISAPISIASYIRSGLSTFKQLIIPNRLVLFGLPYSLALAEYGKINGMTMSVLLFPNVFIMSFSNLLIPEFASLVSKQYKKRILQICQKVFLATSLFSITIAMIFFFLSEQISIIVFKSLECNEYIKILAPLILFIYPDSILDSMLKGLNKQFNVMVCNLLDLILTIGILYFLLPCFGLTGYLLAIMVSEIFNFCISFFQLYKATGFKMATPILYCYIFFAIFLFYEIILLFGQN